MSANEIMIFDTETTGLPAWNMPSEDASQPHIVQLAAIIVNVDTREIVNSMDVIVKPDGWVIPQEVIAIHGITNERATEEGIDESEALAMFFSLWRYSLRVAHNTTFDNRIIRIAIKRFLMESDAEVWKESEYKCTMQMSKPIMKLLPTSRYGYKSPKLVEAYKFFTGYEHQNSHNAMGDTLACKDVYFGCLDYLEKAKNGTK
jgi:DNA polymerase-3 subunit epsilon